MIKRPIIIDTDPGIDDAVAIAVALFFRRVGCEIDYNCFRKCFS